VTDILLLIALSITTIIVIVVAHKYTGFLDFRNLSIIGFFALTYSLNMLGAVIIFFQRQDVHEGIRYSYLLMIFLGFIGVCIGSVLVSMFKHFSGKETVNFLSSDFTFGMPLHSIFPSILTLISLSILLFIAYVKYIPHLPIAYLLSSNMDAAMLVKIRAAGYKTIPQYVTHPMNFVSLVLIPYIIILSFLLADKFKAMGLRFLFIVTFIVGIVFNSYTTALFPVVMLFAILLLALWITKSIKIRHLPLLLIGGLFFPILSAYLARPSMGIFTVIEGELIRHFQRFTYNVPDNVLTHSVNIRMYDRDSGFDDDLLDIDGHDNSNSLTVSYNIVTETWSGDDTNGISDGSDDGTQASDDDDAYIDYDITTI